jgi:hypothetical protein
MSGPIAPPQNRTMLPPGQTRKSGGADRIPMSGDIPRPNPGSVRTRTANRLGVNPDQVIQRPGYTPPVGPPAARPRPQAATPSDADVNNILNAPTDMNLQNFEAKYGPGSARRYIAPQNNIPLPTARPAAALSDPFGGRYDTAAIQAAGAPLAQAIARRISADPTQTPAALVGADPGQLQYEQGKRALASALAASQQQLPGPQDISKGTRMPVPPAAAPVAPPVTAGPLMPPGVGFTPSQGSSPYYVPDPNAEREKGKKGKEGKLKDVPLKANKGEKDHSMYYYQTLGVDPSEGKRAADTALRALVKRAQEHPETITRDEDRLLASAGKSPAFNKSLEEGAIRQRFQDYQAQADAEAKGEDTGGKSSIAKRGTFDPASAAVSAVIANRGAPVWQGNRMPTQQDVNQRAQSPEAFASRFPKFTPPQTTQEEVQPAAPPPQPDEEEED